MRNGLKILWSKKAVKDMMFWQHNYPKTKSRIDMLIEDITNTPLIGLGKPEPLKHELSGFWSRRIDKEHRLIYKVNDSVLFVVSCKDHY